MSNKSPSREKPMVGTASLPSKLWPRLRSSWGDTSRDRQMAIDPNRLLEGVTGADTSQPFFDGSSKEPSDHLIELDDSSMERLPDVQVYWSIGRALLNETDPRAAVSPLRKMAPKDFQQRQAWDSELVTAGRKYLQAARARGEG
jgi:hypothetical protein